MTDNEKYGLLLFKYFEGTITAHEQQQLNQWMNSAADNKLLLDELSNNENLAEAIREYHPQYRQLLETRILKAIRQQVPPQAIKLPLYRQKLFLWTAAAVLLILCSTAFFYIFYNNSTSQKLPAEVIADVKAPQTNKATITLADGRTVLLDSLNNGLLAQQGNVKLVKLANGQIAYQTADGQVIKKMQYNTLTNPRGSNVIDMRLHDGTHVWLNAGSSITYPVAFIENERKVTLTGEGYFEVATDAARKFYVSANGTYTEVLGTHFNVNAYNDENDIKVTLLEGMVKVTSHPGLLKGDDPEPAFTGNNNVILRPGQQASVIPGSHPQSIRVNNLVDVEEVMAWKNGLFNFEQADLKTIMRQLSRWYNVDVQFNKNITETFRFKTSRDTNVSTIFKILEATGEVKFRIEGNRVIIL